MKIIDLLIEISNDKLVFGSEYVWHSKHGDFKIKYINRNGAPMLAFTEFECLPNDVDDDIYIDLFETYNFD